MKCLVVEDDEVMSMMISELLDEMGHRVTVAASTQDATELLKLFKFDLILLDYNLPDGPSVSLSDYVACSCPNSRTILLTGAAVFPHGEHGRMAPGIDWVMRKPVALSDLEALIDHAAIDASRHPTPMHALP